MALGYKIADGYLEIEADDSKGRRQVGEFFRYADGKLRDAKGRYAAEGNLAGKEYMKRFQDGAENERKSGFEGFLRRFAGRFLGIGKMAGGFFMNGFVLKAVAGFAALPAALSATGALVQGIMQIGGALAALAPAAIGTAIFSMITLKTALSGVGDALKAGLSGDAEKFGQALKKLAPAAQEAVKQLVALAPAAREVKRAAQNSFFAPWLADIKPLATIYFPILRKEMAYLAGAAGEAVHEIAQLFTNAQAAQAFGGMLHNFATTFKNISSILPGLVSGFLNLAEGGASALARLTSGFGDLGDKFSAWTAELVDSGRFAAFISNGLDLLGQVKNALLDVAGIVNKVFNAVPGGGGMFAAFGQLADGLNRFLETAQGQQVLTGFFARLQALAGLIMDLVKGALPGLLAVSDGLLKGFQALAPVAEPVGRAIGEALAALAPLLPLLGSLLAPLLQLTATLLRALAAELGPMIKLFSDLAQQVLPLLLPLIDELAAQALPVLVQGGQQFADAFRPLVPLFVELARTVSGQLLAYLPEFLKVSQQLIPVMVQIGQILAETWLSAFESLKPHIPFLIRVFAALLLTFAQFMTLLFKILPIVITVFSWFIKASAWVMGLVLSIRNLPGAIAVAAESFWGWLTGVGAAIGNFFVQVGQWFAELPGKIWGFVQSIPQLLAQLFDTLTYMIGYRIGQLITFFMELPNRMILAVVTLKNDVINFFTSMWDTVVSVTMTAILQVTEFFRQLPSRAASAVSSLWSSIKGAFSAAWNGAINGAKEMVSSVWSTIKQLPGLIMDALSGAGSWLYDTGKKIIQGLIDGMKAMFDLAKRAAHNIWQGIKDSLPGSPVKEGPLKVLNNGYAGKKIVEMVADGIRANMPSVQAALNSTLSGVVPAVPGSNSRPVVNVAAPSVTTAAPVVYVMLDGQEIGAAVTLDPTRVNRASTEGARRRAWTNTGRITAVTA